jgi:hypothetical protein
MYKKTGIAKITEDLELKDFNWWINSVCYDWQNKTAIVEILMKIESGEITYSRNFIFDVPTEWTSDNVINAILELTPFQNSIPC